MSSYNRDVCLYTKKSEGSGVCERKYSKQTHVNNRNRHWIIAKQTWNFCAVAGYAAAGVPVSCGKQEMEKAAVSEITFSV